MALGGELFDSAGVYLFGIVRARLPVRWTIPVVCGRQSTHLSVHTASRDSA